MSLCTQQVGASQRRGCGAPGDSGHAPEAGIKGTPRRGKGFRRYPLRQDGRWPGVGRRKEEEEGGSSHLPAAVPAGWEVAVGHQGLGSVRSKRPAVCNTQPRRRCSRAGSQGVLQDPHQWPLALWAERTMSGWQKNPHPHTAPSLAAHLASCSILPRPWCSPAVGAHQVAGAAGLKNRVSGQLDPVWNTPLHPGAELTNFLVILFPGLGIIRLASGWRLGGLPLRRWGCRGWGRAWHRARGLLVVVGVVGGPGSIRVCSCCSSFVYRKRCRLREGTAVGPMSPPDLLHGTDTYLGHGEQAVATGGRYCPSPEVGTDEEGDHRHCRRGDRQS